MPPLSELTPPTSPEAADDAVVEDSAVSPTETDSQPAPATPPTPDDDLAAALSHLADLEGVDLNEEGDDDTAPAAPEPDEPEAEEAEEETDEPAAEEPDEEEETDTEDDDEEEDPDKDLPDGVKKRIDTLVGMRDKFREQRDEARTKLEDLEAEITQLRAGTVSLQPTAQNPLSDVTDLSKVQERIKAAEQVIAWAEANPDGAEVKDPQTGEYVEFTADEVRSRRLQAERIAEIHGPKRIEYLKQQQQASEYARQVYPELFVEGPLADAADALVSSTPGLLENPHWQVIAGDQVIGAAVRQGIFKIVPVKKSGAANGTEATPSQSKPTNTTPPKAAKPSAEPPVTPSTTTPPRRPANRIAAQNAHQRLLDSGGTDEDALHDIAASLVG